VRDVAFIGQAGSPARRLPLSIAHEEDFLSSSNVMEDYCKASSRLSSGGYAILRNRTSITDWDGYFLTAIITVTQSEGKPHPAASS